MTNGFRAGGFGQGFASGVTTGQQLVAPITQALAERERLEQARRLEEQRLRLMRDQMDAKAQTEFRKALSTDLKDFSTLVGDIAEQRGPEAAQTFINSQSGQQTIATLERRGFVAGSTMSVTNLLQGQIAKAATPQEEGQQAVAEEQAKLKALQAVPEEQREPLMRALGFDSPEATSEFLTLLNEGKRLADTGLGNSTRAQFVRDRLTRLSQQTNEGGVIISQDADGRPVIQIGGAGATAPGGGGPSAAGTTGLANQISGNQLFRQDQRIAGLQGNIDNIDSVIQRLETEPEDFGAAGTIRGVTQGLGQAFGEMTQFLGEQFGLDPASGARFITEQLGTDFFDPDIPDIQILENQLAISLAKLRLEGEGGDIRAFGQVFKEAKDDVKLTGATTAKSAISRMRKVRALFEKELENVTRGIGGRAVGRPAQGQPSGEAQEVDPSLLEFMTPQERKLFE